MVLIYRGTMIAMGSPLEMKTKFMKNDILEIIVSDAQLWTDKIAGLDSVKETALFGANMHAVTYDADKASLAIRKLLDAAGQTGYTIRKIMPSLEDVFVSLIENYDLDEKERKKGSV
jgi:ABC-2 type transport system ATP-binding protein